MTDKNSQWFKRVFHDVIRLEYQQRGTVHFHIAIWCIPKHPPSHYIGRTGMTIEEHMHRTRQETSPFQPDREPLDTPTLGPRTVH